MRALVTGVDSFIGTWLSEALTAAGDEVVGISRRRGIDITNKDAVVATIRAAKPERVYHLAAQSNIARSFKDPIETLTTNVVGSGILLEALREHAPEARVLSIGSSSEYGDTAKTVDFLDEESDLRPPSPYAVSKVAQCKLAAMYARSHRMHVVHVRPFAILGPRKEGDALSDFCKSIALIELGRKDALEVGTTTALRDFVDVRDFVSALLLIADAGEPSGVYNVCNERATSLADLIALLSKASRVEIPVRTDPARVRPIDDQRIVGSSAKVRSLGYTPRFTLSQTLETTLEFWRARV